MYTGIPGDFSIRVSACSVAVALKWEGILRTLWVLFVLFSFKNLRIYLLKTEEGLHIKNRIETSLVTIVDICFC